MNRNGFTLIELIAVITILAVIALITIPAIFNVIDDSKLSSFTRSVEEMENMSIMDYNEFARSGDIIYTFSDNSLVCTGCENGSDFELDFTGEIDGGSGTITVNNGEVTNLDIENSNFKAIYEDGKLVTSKK